MSSIIRRTVVVAGITAAATSLLLAGTASAHIDPDPIAVAAATSNTVSFGVEHGCEESPTTQLQIQIPDRVVDAQPVEKDGWTASVDAQVVTFTGGSLPAETQDDFAITFTAPTAPGEIAFPIIQTCEVGQLDWIETPIEGAAEPEHPAPVVLVTAAEPTDAELVPAPEEEEGEEATTDTTDTGAAAPTDSIATTVVDDAESEDDDSNTGLIIGGIVVAVIVVGGAAYVISRRRPAEGPPAPNN
jgi:periplasmic copper chaperone A